MLVGVEARRVDTDEADVRVLEHRPRPGREVAQAGADGEDDVGLGSEAIGALGTDDADRSGVVRVVGGERRLAGDGLHDGDPVAFGEGRQHFLGERMVHASPGNDQWPVRITQDGQGRAELDGVGPWPHDVVDDWLEQRERVVVRLALHILGQGDERWSAVGRVEHHGDRLRQ